MDFIRKHSLLFCIIVSACFSIAIFLYIFGYKVLNPFYFDWIYAERMDVGQHYIGWYYFFHSPWEFPIGCFDTLSYPFQTSVLNVDAIPLIAIPLKLFRNILPDNFQYFGIYSLICYICQGVVGTVIVKKFCKNDIWGYLIAIFSGILFILLPEFINQSMLHCALDTHFLILACFIPIVYKFDLKKNTIFCAILGFLLGTIHPYLLAMSGIIILIYCLYNFSNRKNLKEFLPFLSYCSIALLFLYLIGAFVNTSGLGTAVSFGDASFNLNGFFNTQGSMRFFDGLKLVHFKQNRGFAYFGLGTNILIIFSIIYILYKFLQDKFNFKYIKEALFIILLFFISIIIASSPKVTFSDIVLFNIPYPDFIMKFLEIFRMSGRFIWIVNYTILVLALCYFVKIFAKKYCLIILILCIVIQFVDCSFIIQKKDKLKYKTQTSSVYDNMLDIVIKYNNIKYIYFDKSIYRHDEYHFPDSLNLLMVRNANWAKNKNIKLNSFYFARPIDIKRLDEAYYKELNNPKDEDIFIFLKEGYAVTKALPETLKYFYNYENIILGRNIEIKGLEKYRI